MPPPSEEETRKAVEVLAKEIGLKSKIKEVNYNDDYQEYDIILEGSLRSTIRQKLIEAYIDNPKNRDIKKEIMRVLASPVEFDDFEAKAKAAAESEGSITLDTSEDTDFI